MIVKTDVSFAAVVTADVQARHTCAVCGGRPGTGLSVPAVEAGWRLGRTTTGQDASWTPLLLSASLTTLPISVMVNSKQIHQHQQQ